MFVWKIKEKCWSLRKKGRSIGRIVYAHPNSGDRFYLRLLLNVVKCPTCFEDLRTVEGIVYPSFKDACFALGLLDDDKEWHDLLQEASHTSSGNQIRELFSVLLMFCNIANSLQLWEKNWELLSEGLLFQKAKLWRMPDLKWSCEQTKNYTLFEIEQLLQKNNRSLKDIIGMPLPNENLMQQVENRLISEEMNYDTESLRAEHLSLYQHLNEDQKKAFHLIMNSVDKKSGKFFFVYGHGGTGKTYLWNTIITNIRSQSKIVLAVASSGIASVLLPGGRTAHSRFSIPIDIKDTSTCSIQQGSKLAELLKQTSLVIWDEAPMQDRKNFEAVDRTLRDILSISDPSASEKPFGGLTFVLGGDFRQILPVILKGNRGDIVRSTINSSKLWDYCTVIELKINMRLQRSGLEEDLKQIAWFSKWTLDIGNGQIPYKKFSGDDEECEDSDWIEIPERFLIDPVPNAILAIISSTYPDILDNYKKINYLQERAILSPRNETIDEINSIMVDSLPGEYSTYLSSDSICRNSPNYSENEALFPPEYLNSISSSGLPNHCLKLKLGAPIMLMRNLNPTLGLCNGTRMVVTQMLKWVIEAEIISGKNVGSRHFIPRIVMTPSDTKLPFTMKRRQFPINICFAMTINKSQGQTLKYAGLFLPSPVFTHGQLYVAISRVTSPAGLKMVIENHDAKFKGLTKNIVYTEVFNNLKSGNFLAI